MDARLTTSLPDRSTSAAERLRLLDEVDFKWLMAGQGWWVDTWRLHTDPTYAGGLMDLALQLGLAPLAQCTAHLRAQTPEAASG